MDDFLQLVFGGDVPKGPLAVHQVAARAALFYVFGLLVVRYGKSRMLGRTTALDVILGFILGSILSRGITGNAGLSETTVSSVVLVAMHWAFTWVTYHSHAVGNVLKGRPKLVVEDGRVLKDAAASSHISIHDLQEELRLSGVEDVAEVDKAFKERNGQISVIRKKTPHILEVDVRGGVQTVRIELQ